MPVAGSISFAPNKRLTVEVIETALPSLEYVDKCIFKSVLLIAKTYSSMIFFHIETRSILTQ